MKSNTGLAKRIAPISLSIFFSSMMAFPVAALPDDSGMFPFVPSYEKGAAIVDMSGLLDAPAGAHGRIRVKDGHFADERGRVRFNATNLTAPANFPTHEEAERLAARLARFGINCVRLHYFDSSYGTFMLEKQMGIIDETGGTRRKLDPKQRDKQDYLIAQFKKRGIFVNMNLHVARTLGPADGVLAVGDRNKGFNYFVPRIIELEKEYAHDLLGHVNPYTGMSYLKDPVVAMVELTNEDSVWRQRGRIENSGGEYSELWKKLWNAWLLKKYGNSEKMFKGWGLVCREQWGVLERGGVNVTNMHNQFKRRDYCEFIDEVERNYNLEMKRYLVSLGLEAPVSGTQLGYSIQTAQAALDYVDHHAYWQHPHVKKDWTIGNDAMVNSRGGNIVSLAAARVLGKPYTISEYNHPYPKFHGAEGQPMLRAYGAFQGWDGVFEYSYNNRQNAEPDHDEYFFSMAARTALLAHMPACATMYLRGDVKEGQDEVAVPLSQAKMIDLVAKNFNTYQTMQSVSGGVVRDTTALIKKCGIKLENVDRPGRAGVPPPAAVGGLDAAVLVSDTKELKWDLSRPGKGIWTVDTANTKVFSGFPDGREIAFAGVKLALGETKLGWATVSLVSHDATGFGEKGAARVLVAATGLSHNGGAKFTALGKHCIASRGADWGKGKTVCEGVPAVVTLAVPAARVKAWALDEAGERKAELAVAGDSGNAVVKLSPEFRTVWYEIAIAQ